jgi:hypothetical protein
MKRGISPRVVSAVVVTTVVPSVLCAHLGARACLFSNVASAYANGAVAYRVKALPPKQDENVWAPFAFRQQFAPGQTLRLREDMREVARSFNSAALHWRVRWYFDDGTQASGVSVTHRYRHRGLYKIEVKGYYGGGRAAQGWYDFDIIDVLIGPPPAGVTWMSVSSSGH